MFSGKSEEAMRRLNRAKIAGQKVQFLTPTLDVRNGVGRVISNGGRRIEEIGVEPTPVHATDPIHTSIHQDTQVIVIDEVQFFAQKFDDAANPLVYRIVDEIKLQAEVFGKRIIWTGLDMNSNGAPFGPVPMLLAISDSVDKLTSVCKCGSQFATRTLRLSDSKEEVLVGGNKDYAARCLKCYLEATLS